MDYEIDLEFIYSDLVDIAPDPELDYLIMVLDAIANPEVQSDE